MVIYLDKDMENPCEKFPYGSRSRQICEGKSELSEEKTNKFRALHGIDPIGGTQEFQPAFSANASKEKPVVEVSVSRKKGESSKGRGCGSCGNRMSAAKSKKPDLVQTKKKPQMPVPRNGFSAFDRAKKFAESLARHIADDGSPASIDDVVFRKSKCGSCPFNINEECSLCGCPLGKNLLNNGKVNWRSESCPSGRWFRQSDKKRPLVNPTRNLIFHIYPKKGAEWNWKWHIKMICDNASLFNGKICIGLNIGPETARAEEVQGMLSGVNVSDWVVQKNSQLAETLTFTELLRCVETDNPNSVTMRGHTKGVTHSKVDVSQKWKELMWQACLDWSSVNDSLSSHLIAGPMKCHEPLVSKQPFRWFYAGTFWWQRDREVFQRDWTVTENSRWFSEYFPGLIFKNEEAACLIHDFTKSSVLSNEYWSSDVEPEWKEWKQARGIA